MLAVYAVQATAIANSILGARCSSGRVCAILLLAAVYAAQATASFFISAFRHRKQEYNLDLICFNDYCDNYD